MATIWKFKLPPYVMTLVPMPAGADILHVHEQNGDICLWALVDADAPEEPRRFVAAGTGHGVEPGDKVYLGSVHIDGGAFVFHVFEIVRGQSLRPMAVRRQG